jgi:quinoprotein dehydrogenase-associated probable ABC transporter substrate-binding protein
MCLRFLKVGLVAIILVLPSMALPTLTVCADPDNLPYSNRAREGYENRIAQLLADNLHRKLIYRWARMDRGFVREFLNRGGCDVLIQVPTAFAPVLATKPFYESTYVFVVRQSRKLKISSFDDPILRHLKIGVQMMGDDYATPGIALTRRGLAQNIVGFRSSGDESQEIIQAVSSGRIDLAIVWGPLAGYYARSAARKLRLVPVPAFDSPGLPFRYKLSMAVRKGNDSLKRELDAFLASQKSAIDRILRSYAVPTIDIHRDPQVAGGL